MDQYYFEDIPIELIKIIFQYLDNDDLMKIYKMRDILGERVRIIYKDYYFWVNRISKRSGYSINNVEYISGERLFENYLKLEKALINTIDTIDSSVKLMNSTNLTNVYDITCEIYLHDLPFHYINNELKEQIRHLYIESLEFGKFIRGYDGELFFDGYTLFIMCKPGGVNIIKIYNNFKCVSCINLPQKERFDLLLLINYFDISRIYS